jgi:hypothetical protein
MHPNATLVQYRHPMWNPLLDLVGEELAGWFMWMCELELASGERLHAYKHRTTRRYLHLTGDARAFTPTLTGHYLPTPVSDALEDLVEHWQALSLPADVRGQCDAAIERAYVLGRTATA